MVTGNLLLAVVAAAQLAVVSGAEGMPLAGRDEVLMFGLATSDKKVSSVFRLPGRFFGVRQQVP